MSNVPREVLQYAQKEELLDVAQRIGLGDLKRLKKSDLIEHILRRMRLGNLLSQNAILFSALAPAGGAAPLLNKGIITELLCPTYLTDARGNWFKPPDDVATHELTRTVDLGTDLSRRTFQNIANLHYWNVRRKLESKNLAPTYPLRQQNAAPPSASGKEVDSDAAFTNPLLTLKVRCTRQPSVDVRSHVTEFARFMNRCVDVLLSGEERYSWSLQVVVEGEHAATVCRVVALFNVTHSLVVNATHVTSAQVANMLAPSLTNHGVTVLEIAGCSLRLPLVDAVASGRRVQRVELRGCEEANAEQERASAALGIMRLARRAEVHLLPE